MDLNTDVRSLRGVGEQRARALARLELRTVGDLLTFYPRSYEDRTVVRRIAELQPGESACVTAMVCGEPRSVRIRSGQTVTRVRVTDDTASLELIWFNQTYIKNALQTGEYYTFYGKADRYAGRLSMANPSFEAEGKGENTGRILPLYPLTRGISQNQLRALMKAVVPGGAGLLPEVLPEELRRRQGLCGIAEAVRGIHFPADYAEMEHASRRLVFEELFVLAAAMNELRAGREALPGVRMEPLDFEEFYKTLPFAPTGAQKRAVREAAADLCSGKAMNRLVQGDVGSGKTLVAAALLWFTWRQGYQSAFMAPTEILAEQHLGTLRGFLEPFGMRVELLTGSLKAAERRRVREALADGSCDVAVGTHALISDDVVLCKPGLMVTDEQHRFGVSQRSALVEKGTGTHTLVMSATPIPRTLALIIYGDLDVSVLDEMPPGRKPVQTFAVGEAYRQRLNGFIRKQVQEGRQVFVVCPMVEENEETAPDLISAEEKAEELKRLFPDLCVDCVHGKMKTLPKEEAMAAFARGDTDILVSTTVVEVGVDVPNASLMIVENAERFGLSQLHQLRGRVGRGPHQSYCILVSDAQGDEAKQRLKVLCETGDGFKVAEEDLKLRGPGDFFGSRQHGLPEMHVADLGADMDVLRAAQAAAQELLARDPGLEQPEHRPLRTRIRQLFTLRAGTIN